MTRIFHDRPARRTDQLQRLAVLTALLPIAATNLAYLVAVAANTVPACLPYMDGCTSISSTGRSNPSQWVFKPLMLLAAALMAMFFCQAGRCSAEQSGRAGRADTVAVCGGIGSAALVLYLAFLGSEGDVYGLLRRYGVSLYFGCTFLAQLLLARRLLRARPGGSLARSMLAVSALLLVLGIGSIPVTNFVADKDQIENIIEWNFALLMQLNFLLAARALGQSYALAPGNLGYDHQKKRRTADF